MYFFQIDPELYTTLKYVLIPLSCALAALLSHMCIAVFHDGVRPILPELTEGRMSRREIGSIAFGLSIGFIVSIGFSFTVPTGILNPWLLFLTTDVLGLLAPFKIVALLAGLGWGLFVVFGFETLNLALNALPVNFLKAMSEISSPVITVFSLFPLLTIACQFGWKQTTLAGFVTVLFRLLIMKYTKISPDAMTIMAGMICLIAMAALRDLKNKQAGGTGGNGGDPENFAASTRRIRKNLPLLLLLSCLVAAMINIGFFSGTEASIFTTARAHELAATNPEEARALVHQAGINDFARDLGFLPMTAMTALTSGAISVKGIAFLYTLATICPNPLVAVLACGVLLVVEVLLLGALGNLLQRFPTIQEASGHIRTSIQNAMEFALLIGSISAVKTMGGGIGLVIGALLYLANEAFGRPVMKLAIGPAAAIGTGILLNVFYLLGLFTPLS